MIASRRPRGRKCSAARTTACSKSGCSHSLTAPALLRLPGGGVLQRRQDAEIEPGEGVQPFPQRRKAGRRLAQLLADGAEHGADARRLRLGGLEQALEAAPFAEVPEQPAHGFL